MRLADLARTNRDPTVSFIAALSGQYIEGGVGFILHGIVSFNKTHPSRRLSWPCLSSSGVLFCCISKRGRDLGPTYLPAFSDVYV